MSEFKDVTADVVKRLNENLPAGDGKEFPNRVPLVKTLERMAGGRFVSLYNPDTFKWISDLKPNYLGLLPTAVSRPNSPVADVLSLHGFENSSLPETLILEDPGRDPRLYAVSYPKDLARIVADSYFFRLPFLVYFRPQLNHAIEERFGGLFKNKPGYYVGYDPLQNDPDHPVPPAKRAEEAHYYPYGWDYLFFTFWQYLNYSNDPFLQVEANGLRHQIEASRKRLVLVIPMLSRDRMAADCASPAKLLAVLGRIRNYLAERLETNFDSQLGRVALAAYSGGNIITRDLLRQLTFSSPIAEVYNFDAPHTEKFPLGQQWVDAAMKWTKIQEAAMVRVYTQNLYPNLQAVTGQQPRDGDQLLKTADGLRSAALISNAGWNQLTGDYVRRLPDARKDAFKIPRTMNDPAQIGEQFMKYLIQQGGNRLDMQHHWFAALMLTDALRRSGFK